jgi:hypothetical protein
MASPDGGVTTVVDDELGVLRLPSLRANILPSIPIL